MTRLRRALGEQADAIRSEAAGYRLDPTMVTIDADAFEAGVGAALAEPDDHLKWVFGDWVQVVAGSLKRNRAMSEMPMTIVR